MLVQTKLLQKPLGKYFTREIISDLLISHLSVENPRYVLDLGSGDGALSKAAAKRWCEAKFITVDIDSDTIISDYTDSLSTKKHQHYKLDALEPSLISDIGLNPEGIDLALCNPPFIKPKWKAKHLDFLRSVGITNELCGVENITAEVLFIIQNLLSLRNGGQLGLIIPDGFISGEKSRRLREFILNENSIDRVIKLPNNSFVGTHIQAHIVIITKGVCKEHISLSKLNDDNSLSEIITITKKQAIDSLDYSYHNGVGLAKGRWPTLLDLGCKISRGKFNSKQCRDSIEDVFHTVNLDPSVKFVNFVNKKITERNKHSKFVIASQGDILIARVGRNLTKKICMVEKGHSLISDCIYRLEVPYFWRRQVFEFLISNEGQELLKSCVRGTGASYLTTSTLLQLPLVGVLRENNND
ncbi:hypothetical protein EYY86_20410 [Hafnia paralvei]|uniref:N-6 DNA methylase n=1 Tax=Hafnia paralvei TaxID=546367 RepID=UPI001034FEBB|nr:N-6 DNA methylase [Hafnia paralvei]TBM09572.1 hypothetical protein EYY86_20410 [Hafnia paralvei]